MLVRPTPAGVESYTILRAADSPQDITFSLSLPSGAELRLVPGPGGFPAGAAVTRGGKDLMVIAPATDRDADGQPVPVPYGVEGSDLTVHVAHRNGSYRYPLLVDPDYRVVEQMSNTNGWHFISWRPALPGHGTQQLPVTGARLRAALGDDCRGADRHLSSE